MITKKGVEVPADLAAMLEADPRAKAVFETMRPSCQRKYTRWLVEAKKPETRERRVNRAREEITAYGRRHRKDD